ncbi:MAG: hypothetical protein WKF40_09155 [Thermoleophilaceae bacterium]
MSRWQAALEKRQAWLGRIVDIGAELFSISSAVVYANTLAQEQPERADEARELAELFCVQARRRANNLFHDLWAQRRRREPRGGAEGARRALQADRGGHPRPLGRRADDRRSGGGRDGRGAGRVGRPRKSRGRRWLEPPNRSRCTGSSTP